MYKIDVEEYDNLGRATPCGTKQEAIIMIIIII